MNLYNIFTCVAIINVPLYSDMVVFQKMNLSTFERNGTWYKFQEDNGILLLSANPHFRYIDYEDESAMKIQLQSTH